MTQQCRLHQESGIAGVAYTRESRLPGVAYTGKFLWENFFCGVPCVGHTVLTGESRLPGIGYTEESRLTGVAYTGKFPFWLNNTAKICQNLKSS